MSVMTVLGEISAQELGVTLTHEHLLIDLTCLFSTPQSTDRAFLVGEPVTPALRDTLVSDPYHCWDNLLLQDVNVQARELTDFKKLGGGCVVDLSTRTLGPYPEQLAQLASRTGLHIIAGTGFYIGKAHPAWVKDADVGELEEFMLKEIQEGINGSSIKAGIIGEIGTSSPVFPDEEKVLRAAVRVQKQTGLAINVHLSIFQREGHAVLDLLEAEGAAIDRVVFSHVDESNDISYAKSLAERGVFVELDTFGSEFAFAESAKKEPTDWERIDMLLDLIEAGYEDRILLSQDICNKIHLLQFGGYGYGHILRAIVPRLEKREVSAETLNKILVRNPARMIS